jgi:hypothetical protein
MMRKWQDTLISGLAAFLKTSGTACDMMGRIIDNVRPETLLYRLIYSQFLFDISNSEKHLQLKESQRPLVTIAEKPSFPVANFIVYLVRDMAGYGVCRGNFCCARGSSVDQRGEAKTRCVEIMVANQLGVIRSRINHASSPLFLTVCPVMLLAVVRGARQEGWDRGRCATK